MCKSCRQTCVQKPCFLLLDSLPRSKQSLPIITVYSADCCQTLSRRSAYFFERYVSPLFHIAASTAGLYSFCVVLFSTSSRAQEGETHGGPKSGWKGPFCPSGPTLTSLTAIQVPLWQTFRVALGRTSVQPDFFPLALAAIAGFLRLFSLTLCRLLQESQVLACLPVRSNCHHLL